MTAVLVRARSDLRSRWKSWIALAVLVGLFGGAVTAAAAGARRTDTSYKRFLVATKAPDLLVFAPPGEESTFAKIPSAELVRLPQVVESGSGSAYGVSYPADVGLFAPADGKIGHVLERKKILAGRDVRPDRADEVTISFTLAKAHHLRVGDRLHVQLKTVGDPGQPANTPLSLRVVGIDAAPIEFPPQSGTGVNQAWGTPALYRAQLGAVLAYEGTLLRLRHTRDLGATQAAIQRLAGGKPLQAFALSDQSVNTTRSIHLQAVALWMLAGLLALAAVLGGGCGSSSPTNSGSWRCRPFRSSRFSCWSPPPWWSPTSSPSCPRGSLHDFAPHLC